MSQTHVGSDFIFFLKIVFPKKLQNIASFHELEYKIDKIAEHLLYYIQLCKV